MKKYFHAALLATFFYSSGYGQAVSTAGSLKTYQIAAGKSKVPIQPTMYGIFFEDINMAADGGVYAELIKNRSFEFNTSLMGWTTMQKDGGTGSVQIIDRQFERPENPHYARVTVNAINGFFGLENEGFKGMGIKTGESYTFSVMSRVAVTGAVKLVIELVDEAGKPIGSAVLTPNKNSWERYSVKIKAGATAQKGRLRLWMQGAGTVDVDMISLFPEHTWKNRPGGLRADLVQKLADLKPGFLRFPGGCIVEGRDLATRYQWKKTIGDIDSRETMINRWNTEFKHRLSPDYYQTFGLGFMEYFMTAEDIGADPLPILNCGMACEFNSGELAPMDKLEPYLQDALDLIEFANGGVDTRWGKLRADLGHPRPFNLKMIGVGNEQWGEQYIARWMVFEKAIKQKYPYIKLVSSVGPDPDGEKFNLLNTALRSLHADILDEHYYRSPQWFLQNVNRYDKYDRKGPKIFAGEYAAQSVAIGSPDNKNNWQCALAEACFMTGLERNADVVTMASYAPLFAHVDGWQWTPDLIWFDNLRCYGTPNYYVQQLYSLNKGTHVVPITLNRASVAGQDGTFATAALDCKTSELIIKICNNTQHPQNARFVVNGKKLKAGGGKLTVLQSDKLTTENSLDSPTAVSPVIMPLAVKGHQVQISVKPYSFNVIRVKVDNV
jgi:alpha-N-arabinofuranosidase